MSKLKMKHIPNLMSLNSSNKKLLTVATSCPNQLQKAFSEYNSRGYEDG